MPEDDADSLLENLVAALQSTFPSGHRSLPAACTNLLDQARKAHNARAYEASAMACRASIEAGTWHYLNLTWSATGFAARQIQRDRELSVAFSRLQAMEDTLVGEGVLSPPLQAAFDRVKREGDSAAHLAETTLRADEQEMRGWTGAPGQLDPVRDPLNPLWMDAPKSLGRIRDTRDVLMALFVSSAARSMREHPEWFV
jgi:hypothetical protein